MRVAGFEWKPGAIHSPCIWRDGVVLQIGVDNRILRLAGAERFRVRRILTTNELISHKAQIRGIQHDGVRISVDYVIAVHQGTIRVVRRHIAPILSSKVASNYLLPVILPLTLSFDEPRVHQPLLKRRFCWLTASWQDGPRVNRIVVRR